MKKVIIILSLLCVWDFSFAQKNADPKLLLQSGPMVGYSTFMEVKLWVQTKESALVHIEYWEKGKPHERKKTSEVQTKKETAYVAHLIADEVTPSKKYDYELFINKKAVKLPYELSFQTQTLWQWRTDAPNFKFVVGSCFYVNETEYDRPGTPYGSNYQILTEIVKQKPDFMLWMGDNVYLREVDWDSRTGIMRRYTHTRSFPELQPLLGSVHHYAIWDDHDYGNNDSDRSFWMKETTLEAFKLFWANPNYRKEGGITGTFQWADVQFFLLDDRYFRTGNENFVSEERVLFGKDQIDWLLDGITASKAVFKFIVTGSQVLVPTNNYEELASYPKEYQYFLSKLRESRVEGIVFLDGDIHHTEMSKMQENKSYYPFYEFTVSPLTAGVFQRNEVSDNTLLVPNTVVYENNFATIDISGVRKNRVLKITVINANGEVKWTREINENELKYKK
ncbi:MAG: alkaline phosphatase D family protein [Flammeovirgaceae bacterium]